MLPIFLVGLLITYLPLPLRPVEGGAAGDAAGVFLLVLLNAVLWWIGGRMTARRVGQRDRAGTSRALVTFKRLRFSLVLWTFLAVNMFHWPAVVEKVVPDVLFLPLAGDLLLIAPLLVMITVAMINEWKVSSWTGDAKGALGVFSYLNLRYRMELAIILLPWALLTAAMDTVWYVFGPHFIAETIVSLLLAVMLIFFGPLFLRVIWPTRPLPAGPLKRRLHAFAAAVGFRYRDVFLWRTQMQIPNAAVIGVSGFLRYVFMTDLLVACCSDEELESIFAHEAGHIKRHHFAYYIFFIVGFVASLAAMGGVLSKMGWGADPDVFPLSAGVLIYAIFYWGFLFGYISRRFEREADLFSLTHSSRPGSFIAALDRLASLSGRSRSAGGWRHFSIERRIRFLEDAAGQEGAGLRAVRAARRLKAVIVSIPFVSAAILLFSTA